MVDASTQQQNSVLSNLLTTLGVLVFLLFSGKKTLKKSRIGCVLKSDSYGLGLIEVTKKLVKIGCNDFFLTNLGESLKVRKECSKSNIILLNGLIKYI